MIILKFLLLPVIVPIAAGMLWLLTHINPFTGKWVS